MKAIDNTAILQAMQKAWREEEPRLANSPVNDEVVNEIAWRLIQNRMQPTAEHIRAVHGGGSPNTVHGLLRAFYINGELERRWKAPPPSPLPAEFTTFADAWKLAVSIARETMVDEMEAERDALATASEAVASLEDACRVRMEAADTLIEQVTAETGARIAAKDVAMDELRAQLAAESEGRRADAVVHATVAQRVEQLTVDIDALKVTNRVQADDLRERFAELASALDRERAALSDGERLRNDLARQADRVTLLREANDAAREQHERQITEVKAQLEIAHQRADEAVEQRIAAESEMSTVREDLADAYAERDDARASLAQTIAAEREASTALAVATARLVDLQRSLQEARGDLASTRDAAAVASEKWRQLVEKMTAQSAPKSRKAPGGADKVADAADTEGDG